MHQVLPLAPQPESITTTTHGPDTPFKYRMILKFDGFERVVEGEYPAPVSASGDTEVPICDAHAASWFTERNHLIGGMDATCVVCAHQLPDARSSTAAKPVCYVLMAADGRMFWDREECVYDEPSQADAQLENCQQDEPDDGWHIAPLYAAPRSTPSATAAKESDEYWGFVFSDGSVWTDDIFGSKEQAERFLKTEEGEFVEGGTLQRISIVPMDSSNQGRT